MQPPNVLIQPIYSGLGLVSSYPTGTWGEVIQTNRDTLSYNTGNIVFYNPQDIPLIYSFDTNQFYNVVDESKIYFIEAGFPPPP